MNIVRSENPSKFETWITRHHIDTFVSVFYRLPTEGYTRGGKF
jgi:hypothetical protein